MYKVKAVSALALVLGVIFAHGAAEAKECGRFEEISYCYHAGDASSQKLIYFFHGYGDNVESWNRTVATRGVHKKWQQASIPLPHVVTVSRGPWWYTDAAHAQDYDRFLNWFERTHLGFLPARSLYGESMGAHNAYRWLIDSPENFTRVALTCPAFPKYFVTDAPHGPGRGLFEFLAESVMSSAYYFSAQPDYNPLHHSLSQRGQSGVTAAHLVVLDNDSYGFYDGGMALYRKLLKEPGVITTLEVQTAYHCEHEASGLARFLGEY